MKGFYGRLENQKECRIITLDEGVKQFQNYNAAKNLSPHSIRYYDDNIKLFRDFYGGEKKCDGIDENIIYAYIAYMRKNRNINDISLNAYLRAVRALCYYFIKMGYMPGFKINLVRTQKQIKETYTDSELSILLEKPKISETTFSEYRNWVIINYLLATGNREGTLCDLRVKDIDFDTDTIRLTRTKNRREQIIPMSTTIRGVLREYLKYRKGEPDDYLFCSVNGERLAENGIRIAIRKYNQKRGVSKTSVHLFRHTFAKKWILNGGDVFRLQKILGHSSMEIVKEYVNMFSDDLKRDFDIFNPLEEFSTKGKGNGQKISLRRT